MKHTKRASSVQIKTSAGKSVVELDYHEADGS